MTQPTGRETLSRAPRVLRTLAFLVLVFAGLREASGIVVPVLLAALIAMICYPAVRRLTRWHVPEGVSIALVILLILLILAFTSIVVGRSVSEFTGSVSEYKAGLGEFFQGIVEKLNKRGIMVSVEEFTNLLDTGAVLELISTMTESLFTAISDIALQLLIVLFMLMEAAGFPAKLRRAIGKPDSDLAEFNRGLNQVYRYLALKALFGLVTGIVMAILCLSFGVDFPVLWGVVAFLFNFVPTVGSYLSPIPPVILALIQHGGGSAIAFTAIWLGLTSIQGQLVEPAVMGRRLGLSPLVVLLSLIFWNWILGPVGMILSLPLTMIVRILLEQDPESHFVAVLLGPAGDDEPEPSS